MSKDSSSLSLIIPVYLEGLEVYQVLSRYHDFLQSNFDEYELIVALDGDDKETHSTVKRFEMKHDNVRVHHSPKRRGKGGAIVDSFSVVKYKYTAFSDADTSISPIEINKLIKLLEENDADVAIGSRYVKGSRRSIPVKRLILSRVFNLAVRILTGLSINDTQCGTKALSSRFLPGVLKYQSESGWAFDVQMLYILKSIGARIAEVPITWIFSEGSRMKLTHDVPKMLFSALRARFVKNNGQ